MNPTRIRYAKTSDGVSVGWAESGAGPSAVLVPAVPFSNAELIWHPAFPPMHLAKHFRVVWYDARGTGVSERDATDFSLDAMERDLLAVVEASGGGPLTLIAYADGPPIAMALRHTIRISSPTSFW